MAEPGKMMKIDEGLIAIPLLPVGTVYQTIDADFNPNGYFPGNWDRIGNMQCFDTHITSHAWFRRE